MGRGRSTPVAELFFLVVDVCDRGAALGRRRVGWCCGGLGARCVVVAAAGGLLLCLVVGGLSVVSSAGVPRRWAAPRWGLSVISSPRAVAGAWRAAPTAGR